MLDVLHVSKMYKYTYKRKYVLEPSNPNFQCRQYPTTCIYMYIHTYVHVSTHVCVIDTCMYVLARRPLFALNGTSMSQPRVVPGGRLISAHICNTPLPAPSVTTGVRSINCMVTAPVVEYHRVILSITCHQR